MSQVTLAKSVVKMCRLVHARCVEQQCVSHVRIERMRSVSTAMIHDVKSVASILHRGHVTPVANWSVKNMVPKSMKSRHVMTVGRVTNE